MRNVRFLLLWLLLGAAGAVALVWAYPLAFPFAPRALKVTRDEAIAIALARFKDLGEPVPNAYVVASFQTDAVLERRLQLARRRAGSRGLRESGLPDRVLAWEVTVYPPGALPQDWTYQAEVAFTGEVARLRLNLDPEARGNPLAPPEARARADAFLGRQGFDLRRYREPEIRSEQLAARTDLAVRYRDRRPLPGAEGLVYGVLVRFSGDRLTGFSHFEEDPEQRSLQRIFQQNVFAGVGGLVLAYLALLVLTVPFLKRYHEGEIGVRRGVQIFLLMLALGLTATLLGARATAQGWNIGATLRQPTTWLLVVVYSMFRVLPTALLAFVAWSVGESICRERWGGKLAAFDALFQGEWGNATVARSSLAGAAAGTALAGGLVLAFLPLQRFGAWPVAALLDLPPTAAPGFDLLAVSLFSTLPLLLVLALCLLPVAVRRLGRGPGVAVAVLLGSVLLLPPSSPLPFVWGLAVSLFFVAALVVLFLRHGFLAVLTATVVSTVLLAGYPLLTAAAPSLAAQGWLALAVLLAPLLVSLRHLAGGQELVYRYEDVPPHVRRIAERERQRVELETARRIQSSILPDLPPSLHGVALAHAYLPASEVGGDFYDVLALEDGRLAVAVGDVAGHGVSSGLVMSMAKSALAVQVTFNPEVAAVFGTLNRTVYQTARKRLLATLCYALLDPESRELLYASAGHLFPYVVSPQGGVRALESIAYPLGVRGQLVVEPRQAQLASGDILFLYSDGLVEARTEHGDEFGFERLEQSLARHARRGVEGMRDGVLQDIERFTGGAPREDDQTVLVLKVP
ncbi:MAG TPA: PP2C family protein-serine/threonine phosphatase [Thermoanaerobaculia bacterium]|nr:PP2C family protein-serine/threonine phosphatase [Thermoanaerobaculia bacterium]